MFKRIKELAAGGALALALCAAAPAAALAAPAPTGSLDEAITWAEAYVDEGAALLSDGQIGWELLSLDEGWDLQAVTPDTSWYSASKQSFTLKSGSELAGLAQLVNGGTNFAGKSISLSGDVTFIRTDLTPIGKEGAAFEGSFDGAGHLVRGFSIGSTADEGDAAENFGLFGLAGNRSTISNIAVEGATVTITRSSKSTQAISNVGTIVGKSQGTVSGCSVSATVKVDVDTPQTSTVFSVINRVGGVVGCATGDVKGCSFSGALTMQTDTAGSDSTDSNGNSTGLVVAKGIGGVVGYLGDPASEGKPSKSTHGSASGCAFTGSIDAQSPCEAGTDRFGEKISVKTEGVGGIVGYSQGSVAESHSEGTIYAPQCTMGGGIVGSLRAMSWGGLNSTATMDNGSLEDQLEVKDCYATSSASLEVLHAGGGIVGSAGSFTTIVNCYNQGTVTVDRWNKPAGGGISGQTHGNIKYCYNTGQVATKTGGGYYVAGISGMVLFYKQTDGTANTPTPEVYGCYNAGMVNALTGMKSAGLVGQNEGYLHDCLLLKGTCVDGDTVYHVADGSSGTFANCSSVSADELRSASSVGTLNRVKNSDGWSDGYFTLAAKTEVDANNGYPVLSSLAAQPATTMLSGATASCTKNASYTGGDAIPEITASLNGATLVQNADFYVVPQSGAVDLGEGYKATIVGIGAYAGTAQDVCAYGISKGDLSTCSVAIKSQKFDYEAKTLKADDIVVTDSMGNVLPSSWYSFAFETMVYEGKDEAYKGKIVYKRYVSSDFKNGSNISLTDPKYSEQVIHYGYYPVTITATASAPYEGSTTGAFKITPASLMSDVDVEYMTWDGQSYAWNDKQGCFEDGTAVISYTGSKITPTVTKVTYKGHELEEGVDYRIVYGNPNSDTDTTDSKNYNNIGSNDSNSTGCATVRFIGGGHPGDFDNFVNMYFIIHGSDAPAASNIADCTIVASNMAYTGKELAPVKLLAPDGSELSSDNYQVEYKNNINEGTATFTVRGSRNYAGTATGSFYIYDPAKALGFEDVDTTAWYVTDGTLGFCKTSGLITGTSPTTFEPLGGLTRAQLSLILWRFACPDEATNVPTANTTGIADVQDNQWYTAACNWAVKEGIVNGYTDDAGKVTGFGPNDQVTREQVCRILMNYAQTQNGADIAAQTDEGKLDAMPDKTEVSGWAEQAVAWALTQGVISGATDDSGTAWVQPTRSIVRCEMGKIMKNCTSDKQIITKPTKA